MANLADFSLKAKGSKESLSTLKEILMNCFDKKEFDENKKHFYIDDCWIMNESDKTLEANGCCSWSAWSCLFCGEDTYCKPEKEKEYVGLTHIQAVAKELNLEVEIFGNEMGVDFAEYYKINNKGEIEKELEIADLSRSVVPVIAEKFNLNEQEIHDFIIESCDDEISEKMQDIFDKEIDDYVFGDSYISYPANYAKFENGIKYGEFTI